MLWGRPFLEIFTPPSPWSPILLNRLMKECHLLSDPPSLNILFRQITTFIKVCVAFVFGLPTLQLIRFTKFFQSKGLKQKNKDPTKSHKCSCGICFWASDPLIDRFYKNLSIKAYEALKQRPHKLLWMLWFDEKIKSNTRYLCS